MRIEVQNLYKKFGSYTALKDVSIDIPEGELTALLGPSGSGKTTLLRILSGLDYPDSGSVRFDGVDAGSKSFRERNVGFVFQHYALFRHMTVYDNVAFGLKVRPRATRPSAAEIKKKVEALLGLVHLECFSDRLPSQLSGGQRQRVALARALAVEPRVLLLDEPFGSLDAKVRQELRRWLRRFHDEMKITSVFVTHDQEEALEVSDKVVIMNEGRVEQSGTPEEVYDHPANPFIFNFLGSVNLFHGRVDGGTAYVGEAAFALPGPKQPDSERAFIYVRPHQLEILHEPVGEGHFAARVMHINPAGPTIKVEFVTEWGDPVQVELTRERYRALDLKRGMDLYLCPREVKVFTRKHPEQ